MCPCLENCKTCKNKDYCEECWATWLLQPEKTSCNKSCEYCLTPYFEKESTKEKGRCVNCLEEFGKFTYDNKCYDEKEIPYFNYTEYDKNKSPYTVQKFYHVIDKKCNMLTACKKGCHKCSTLKTDLCTECEEGYYREDPFNVTRKTFKCFSKVNA